MHLLPETEQYYLFRNRIFLFSYSIPITKGTIYFARSLLGCAMLIYSKWSAQNIPCEPKSFKLYFICLTKKSQNYYYFNIGEMVLSNTRASRQRRLATVQNIHESMSRELQKEMHSDDQVDL